jgi:hypothetical protein
MEATLATNSKEPAMLKKLILATASLAFAAPVFAHDGHGRHWQQRHHFHHFHQRPVVVVPPPRVYYAPAPVYYAPPPVVYRPAPVYSAPVYSAPVPQSSVSIRLHFPL